MNPLKHGGRVTFSFFNLTRFLKWSQAFDKKSLTVPLFVKVQFYGLLLYNVLLLRQSKVLSINSTKSAVLLAVLLFNSFVEIQVRIVDDIV